MADIDYDELYTTYTNLGYNPARAASYTAYAYLTGNKIPTTRQYTQNEWYKNSAPDYYSVISTPDSPNDPLSATTKKIRNAKSSKDVFAIAEEAPTSAIGVGKLFETTGDYRQYLTGLYREKVAAEKGFRQQTQKFTPKVEGLPSVTARYGVADDTYTKGKVTRQIIAFKPATDYVNSKVASWTKALKKGTDYNTSAELADLTTKYRTALTKAVNEKLLTSARTPFVDAAYKRASGGK